jgi:hypothetical protein
MRNCLLLLGVLFAPVNAWTSTSWTFRSSRGLCLSPTSQQDYSAETAPKTLIPAGSVVTIDCRLKPEGGFVPEPLTDGVVLHDEDGPVRLTFVLGAGNYLPGLHDLVAGMQLGDSEEGVSLDGGWGARNPDLVASVTFESAGIADPSQIKAGSQLNLSNGMQCTFFTGYK